VLSALGLVASERRRDTARTVMLSGGELNAARVADEVAALREAIGAGLDGAEAEATYELRYRGQAFELAVPGSTAPDPAELEAEFEAEHERRYGHRNPDAEVELVNIGLALTVAGPEIEPRAATAGDARRSRRRARFGGEWVDADVVRGEPEAGTEAPGPCVLELPEATLVLPPRWEARVDDHGTVVAAHR
jgi:N-methylhydantoinase A